MKSVSYYYDGTMCRYEYTYPGDLDLLKIFPESKDIVPLKLKVLLLERRKLDRTETIPYLKKCESIKDPFAKAFWQEAYRYFSGYRKLIEYNITRLYRLRAIINGSAEYGITQRRLEIAKSIPIIDLYAFARLKRSGRGFIAACPIHGDQDPSFHIYPNNSWHCFGCGKGGDSINFIQRLHNLNFKQSINFILGARNGR